MNKLSPASPVAIISTHLDDAVLSCGHFLSLNTGINVITVLAGAPDKDFTPETSYNAKTTGITNAPDALRARKQEDAEALEYLSARQTCLDLLDNDYLHENPRTKDKQEIMDAISKTIDKIGVKSVFSPIGFDHSDHIAVSNACIELAQKSNLEWYLYADQPYQSRVPNKFAERLAALKKLVKLEDVEPVPANGQLKSFAFKLYKSQYDATVDGRSDFDSIMSSPEPFWRVVH